MLRNVHCKEVRSLSLKWKNLSENNELPSSIRIQKAEVILPHKLENKDDQGFINYQKIFEIDWIYVYKSNTVTRKEKGISFSYILVKYIEYSSWGRGCHDSPRGKCVK